MSNVLQIKVREKDKEFQHFNIIENEGGGNCLFLALLEFLKKSKKINSTIPSNADDLRLLAVNYLLTASGDEQCLNFDKFKEGLVLNLQDYIPNIVNYGDNKKSDAEIVNSYWEYMTTSGKEGTFAELCAIAELFKFVGFLIQQNDPNSFSCYEFGFTDNLKDDESKPMAYLLFTGNISSGHFRLLEPHLEENSPLLTGRYRRVHEKTLPHLSRTTIIEHLAPPCSNEIQFICDLCEQSFKTQRGMKVHRNKHMRKTDSNDPLTAKDKEDIQIHSFDDFVNLLSRCKNNIKVLKRIPRGARISAANALAKRIEDCVANPAIDKVWQNLLLFTYTALRVPSDQSKKQSLTSLVKQNIGNQKLQIPKSRNKKSSISVSQRVEAKIADGNVRGAVKILSSRESLAKQDIATLEELKTKHPPRKTNFTPEPPDPNIAPLQVSEREVYFTITHFPPGSSAGVDGFLPEHLKELTSPATGEAGLRLLRAITNVSNLSLTGKIESVYTKILYGASLCALNKEAGGIRPIAVGNTFRRITAKLACSSIHSEIGLKLRPRQTGFGCPNGAEAAAHATRTFVKKYRRSKKVILKIDFKNAFNEIDREKFLNDVRINTPAIYPFILQCYCSATLLFFGEDIISSENGDPCGPVLFCFAIDFIVNDLLSEFVVFYLDDGTVGGEVDLVLQDFRLIMNKCQLIGLTINTSKCELFFCSERDEDTMNEFDKISPGIKIVDELTLLGAPISENAIGKICKKKMEELRILFNRLTNLNSHHIAFYILKNCFALPKLTYILRTTPLCNHQTFIDDMDNLIKTTLETLTNCQMDNHQWILSSLPIHCGGLGVRRVKDVYLPAFLSSVNRAAPIVSEMLSMRELNVNEVCGYKESLAEWNRWNQESSVPTSQKKWDCLNVDRLVANLNFEADNDRARFLAIQKKESSAWLFALPSREIGTLMNNNVFRISVGLRLGCDICKPHKCNCGESVDSKGRHGLKCKKSCGRASRHSELNNIIKRAIASADISAKLEPVGLCREDGKRVDGITLIPWSKGRFMIWDATCTDTFAVKNIKRCTSEAGKGAESAANRKTLKYASLIHQNYQFIPFAVETMGPWCTEAIRFVEELGQMIAEKTCEARSTFFLKQRLSMAIQRGNASSIMGSMFATNPGEDSCDII